VTPLKLQNLETKKKITLMDVNVSGVIKGTGAGMLPALYTAARDALAECASLDECKDWADRAEALRSYARQADDPTLLNNAMRIKARAVRRCGELLAEIAPGTGAHRKSDGAVTLSETRKGAAVAAGLSERQRVNALRVAAIPAPVFEAAVDAANPPSVTRLADMGRKRRVVEALEVEVVDDLDCYWAAMPDDEVGRELSNLVRGLIVRGAALDFPGDRAVLIAAAKRMSAEDVDALRTVHAFFSVLLKGTGK
jgi:hypothetical protein